MDQRPLYFAYGSNMVLAQMANRCPGAEVVGPATLDGYRFLINERGVATIVPDEDGRVHGVVWRLGEGHWDTLDVYEGVRIGNYRRIPVEVDADDGARMEVVAYLDPRTSQGPPRAGYLEGILDAAAHFRFPEGYREALAGFFEAEPELRGA